MKKDLNEVAKDKVDAVEAVLTEADIDLAKAEMEAAKAKIEKIRDDIKKASANQPKLRVETITRELHSFGILEGEAVVSVVFSKDGTLRSIDEIQDMIYDRAGHGCRMISYTGFLEQDKREFITLIEYFPEFYQTLRYDGSKLMGDYRPPYGHMQIDFSDKVTKFNFKCLSLHDELIFTIGSKEDYDAFMKFYDKNMGKMINQGVKMIVIPNIESDYVALLKKFIVQDDLRVRYSFPIDSF